jgi:hypothetical protein
MDKILLVIISGLVGSILTIFVTVALFSIQSRSETNRIYLKSMFDIMKNMYISMQKNEEISDELAFELLSLKVIGLKKFAKLKINIDELNKLISEYNNGVRNSLNSTTSAGQITQKESLEKKLNEVTKILYKMT